MSTFLEFLAWLGHVVAVLWSFGVEHFPAAWDYFLAHWWGLTKLAAVLLVLWFASVLRWPYVRCWWCRGRGQLHFLWWHRDCWKCDGGRRKQRWTARMIGRGKPRQPGTILAPRTRPKSK